jgi:hypothetical protein
LNSKTARLSANETTTASNPGRRPQQLNQCYGDVATTMRYDVSTTQKNSRTPKRTTG